MLNYVWFGLIVLGVVAALGTDIGHVADDTFRNGKTIEAEVVLPDSVTVKSGKSFTLQVRIPKETFSKHYNIDVENDVTVDAKISFGKTTDEASIYFTIDETYPLVWQIMAGASGEENDLSGMIYFPSGIDGTTLLASFVPEEVGFLKLKEVTQGALDWAAIAVEIVLGLIGVMALWLGLMKIADEAGIIKYIAAAMRPIMMRLFPDVPHDHPAMGSMIMNISATFLGLGNAATPFGIKAMEDLNTLNDKKDTATNAMCTFLVINTASFALMPATAIAVRAAAGSAQPAIIIGTTMFGSFCATVIGITAAKIFEKFPLKISGIIEGFKKRIKGILITVAVIAAFIIAAMTGLLGYIAGFFSFITVDVFKDVVQVVAVWAIPLVIVSFVLIGVYKKVKIYETFVEGAKEGFDVAVTIIPYLVAMLMAIGIFKAGGAMNVLAYIVSPFTDLIGMPADVLPMAFMRPLSGSGSLGLMAEIIASHGPDSFVGILASTFYGSTETTFYVLAVYFGAVNIKNTRHALPAGLIADLGGLLAAVFIVRLLFS